LHKNYITPNKNQLEIKL